MPAPEWVDLLLTGIGSATAGAGVTGFVNRKKTKVETEAVEVDSAEQLVGIAMTLLQPMQEQISGLKEQTELLTERIKHLESENACLRNQIRFLEAGEESTPYPMHCGRCED